MLRSTDLAVAVKLAAEFERIKNAKSIVENDPTLVTLAFSKGVIGDGDTPAPQVYLKPGEPEFDAIVKLVRASMARDIQAIGDELRTLGVTTDA